MKKKKLRFGIGFTAILGVCALMLLLVVVPGTDTRAAEGDTGQPAPNVLLLTDVGNHENILAKMIAYNWEVTTITTVELDVLAATSGGLEPYSIAWVPSHENYIKIRGLVQDGGVLEQFAQDGGVVVIMGLTPTDVWLDIAPGGIDGTALPSTGAGVVAIADDTHPMISGQLTGGLPLIPSDLDPEASGGRGNIINPPDGTDAFNGPDGTDATVIAVNDEGPVIIDHRYGAGHVFVSTLFHELDICRGNVLLYVQSIAR